MNVKPISLRAASGFIEGTHRHHPAPRGWLFGVAIEHEGQIVGVGVAGRPIARMLQDGSTAEITRVATDGTPNACSMIYGALRRALKALGYRRVVTYILESEPGTSLRAAGRIRVAESGGGSWDRIGRPRTGKAPTCRKVRYEAIL